MTMRRRAGQRRFTDLIADLNICAPFQKKPDDLFMPFPSSANQCSAFVSAENINGNAFVQQSADSIKVTGPSGGKERFLLA